MHETSLQTGRLFLEIYAQPNSSIVEIGSYDVNGGLRSFAPPSADYIGVDVSEGPGVDRVVVIGEPLPFDDASIDAILASSVLEHDPMFWRTFEEMCRVIRPGGFIYLNVPSNGPVHRYPVDCWRFYPDAGLALQDISQRGPSPVTLIESFIARQSEHEPWNDFVAVFQRDGGETCAVCIHPRIACENIYFGQRDVEDRLPEDFRLKSYWEAEAVRQHHIANTALAELGLAREEIAHWRQLAVQQHHDLDR